jgi:hypothetical protein
VTDKPGERKGSVARDPSDQWAFSTIVLLGAWLAAAAFTIDYGSSETAGPLVERITAERGLWPVEQRAALLRLNDVVIGLLVAVLGLLCLDPGRLWARWAVCLAGLWLLVVPIVLWAPTSASYLNNTVTGALLIAFSVLIPGVPGRPSGETTASQPPGWSYDPSTSLQRVPIVALAWLGFFLSRYLASYQLGHISSAWDPFFGDGTMHVLDSEVSKAFPVSDAGLGSLAYMVEALMGYLGGRGRWRTMPWTVIFFGILIVPVGATSVILIILQPVAVGAWCTICLVTAAAMLIMIPLTLDEVVAVGQYLATARRQGQPFWRDVLERRRGCQHRCTSPGAGKSRNFGRFGLAWFGRQGRDPGCDDAVDPCRFDRARHFRNVGARGPGHRGICRCQPPPRRRRRRDRFGCRVRGGWPHVAMVERTGGHMDSSGAVAAPRRNGRSPLGRRRGRALHRRSRRPARKGDPELWHLESVHPVDYGDVSSPLR